MSIKALEYSLGQALAKHRRTPSEDAPYWVWEGFLDYELNRLSEERKQWAKSA